MAIINEQYRRNYRLKGQQEHVLFSEIINSIMSKRKRQNIVKSPWILNVFQQETSFEYVEYDIDEYYGPIRRRVLWPNKKKSIMAQ